MYNRQHNRAPNQPIVRFHVRLQCALWVGDLKTYPLDATVTTVADLADVKFERVIHISGEGDIFVVAHQADHRGIRQRDGEQQ
ncbi:hypothetical protein COW64_12335 [bacterium (Candidatus Blackallbacteria) CG18_big_fil_WC_8_21_14_2_50_49_26]|nr:MAG: hypothetical protein COW64_12335 [bacterium (Candidatus Blackallbacteria) CG18_big_fil_WC_8_21_14_2_50_49_26]